MLVDISWVPPTFDAVIKELWVPIGTIVLVAPLDCWLPRDTSADLVWVAVPSVI
jgi:hypothetical protein